MHFKCLINEMRSPADRRSLKGNFKAEAQPGGHHFAVEEINDAGQVVEGTYVTFLPDAAAQSVAPAREAVSKRR